MLIEKVANTMIGGGSVTSIYFGLTPDKWQVVGIVSGIVIGIAGVVVKTVVDWHFKAAHLKLAQDRAAVLAAGDSE